MKTDFLNKINEMAKQGQPASEVLSNMSSAIMHYVAASLEKHPGNPGEESDPKPTWRD